MLTRFKRFSGISCLMLLFSFIGMFAQNPNPVISGELRIWHKVILTFDGPSVDESESTFRNYRLDVTFTKGTKSFKVPGYFAADGNASETSASSGNKWRVIFTPDEVGIWNYSVSFRQGNDIAISFVANAGTIVAGLDDTSGSFTIDTIGTNENGFYAKGMLKYAEEHYGQFAGNKEWHVKAGPGSPEDFFGYNDFDNTVDNPDRVSSTQVQDIYLQNLNGEGLHYYKSHIPDWKQGDPTWKGEKGKAIIGALNYMASIGVNSLYMILLTVNDDSDNTWPWTARDKHMSYDVSKLDQWDIVFTHMDRVGISSTYYLCESANSKLLDGGNMTLKYPIYYREIIARFGYHLGIRFNLGEESNMSKEQQSAASKLLSDLDPYNKIIAGHSSYKRTDQIQVFEYLLGKNHYNGPNYQLHEADDRDHLDLIMWRDKSAITGHKWIVANDESWGINNSTGSNGEGRMLTYAWRTYMAGAEGMFQYTAYGTPEIGDITMENFRLIENTQKILIACKNLFLKPEINPTLYQMKNENALVGNPTGNNAPFCLAKNGEIYIVYRSSATNQKPLNLTGVTGDFHVKWYDARNGGEFQNGSVTNVIGGSIVDLGNPPSNPTGPWAVVVYKDQDPNKKYISVLANGCAGSNVSGGGAYNIGVMATVNANAASGCKFVNWTDNGIVVSSANPYTFSVVEDRQLVSNFSQFVDTSCVLPWVNPGITVNNTNENISYGPIDISCIPNGVAISINLEGVGTDNSDYCRVYYTVDGGEQQILKELNGPLAKQTFSVSGVKGERVEIIVNASTNNSTGFYYITSIGVKSIAPNYFLTTSSNSIYFGSVTGDGAYNFGKSITVLASAFPCYKFDYWTENDAVVSTDSNYTFTLIEDRSLKANFSTKTFTVTADPIEGGLVSGDVSYICGGVITVLATPNPNFKFAGWTANNEVISLEPLETINIESDFQVKAKFDFINSIKGLSINDIIIYPNPASSKLYIDFANAETRKEIRIFNSLGQLAFIIKNQKDNVQIDVPSLKQKGVVTVQVISDLSVLNQKVFLK